MTGFKFRSVDRENLGETIYGTLAEALIQGHLKPNDRIKIRDIAQQMETSVTPVRDAILRLVQDGAFVLKSPRDIRVRALALSEYLEIRNIRAELEGFAAAEAARQAKAADIGSLVSLIEENEKALRAHDSVRAIELNQAFHFELATVAKLPILLGVLRRLWLPMGPLISQVYDAGGRAMIDHHYPVVEAIRRGDAEAARQAIREDIFLGGKVIYDLKMSESPITALSQPLGG